MEKLRGGDWGLGVKRKVKCRSEGLGLKRLLGNPSAGQLAIHLVPLGFELRPSGLGDNAATGFGHRDKGNGTLRNRTIHGGNLLEGLNL